MHGQSPRASLGGAPHLDARVTHPEPRAGSRTEQEQKVTWDLMLALTESSHCEPGDSVCTVFFCASFVFPEILLNVQFGTLLSSLNVSQCS